MYTQHPFNRPAPLGAARTPAGRFIRLGSWAMAATVAATLSACGGSGSIDTSSDSSSPGTSPSGWVVTTVAGAINYAGPPNFADGPATQATLNFPAGVAAGPGGRVYIADSDHNRIRMLSADGTTVSTVAGGGTGVGPLGPGGFCNNPVDGPCASATFKNPGDMAVDASGSIYVADSLNNSIRKITNPDTSSCRVSTLAGSCVAGNTNGAGSAASFISPIGLALDGAGNVYVTDVSNNNIRKVTPGGVVTTVAGNGAKGYANGPAVSAMFNRPLGIGVDSKGNVYVADSTNNVIRKITPEGVSTFAGSGIAGATDGTGASATFDTPEGLAIDAADNLYVTNYDHASDGLSVMRKITPDGQVTTVASGCNNGISWDPMPLDAACFSTIPAISIDASGAIYAIDSSLDVLRKIAPAQ
jgi:sugar lactone lactonase YvrE